MEAVKLFVAYAQNNFKFLNDYVNFYFNLL